MDGQTPRKKSILRKLARAFIVLSLLGGLLLAALPWLLSTPPARDAVVTRVNKMLAPSRIGVRGLSLSWTGPLRLTGVTLKNGEGKTLVDAKRAELDRGLIALLRNPSRLGTVTLDGAAVDIERRVDGSIDLVDALSPPKPKAAAPVHPPKASGAGPVDVTLRVTRGSLRLTTPELAEPLTAESFDMDVRYPAARGENLSWRIRLAKPAGGTAAETLGVDGEFDHQAAADPALTLTVKGERWPLALAAPGAVVRGRLDGALKAARTAGAWSSSGDAKLLGLDASGPALAGDRLAFDSLGANWDVAQSGGTWSVRNVGVVSPVGTLSARGSVDPANTAGVPDARVEGRIDLAALAKQIPHTLRLREGLTLEHGSARVLIQVKKDGETQTGSVEAAVSDLVARDKSHAFTLRDPATVSAKATRSSAGVTLQTFAVKTAFLDLTGSGDIASGVKLSGTIDLGGLKSQLKDLIDFGGVELAGKGRLAADYRKTGAAYVGRSAVEVRGLKVAGLTGEPVVRDSVRFDAAVSGPADPTGLPATWESLRVNAVAGPDKVILAGKVAGGVTSVSGSASLPVSFSQRDGRADVALAGRMKPGPDGNPGLIEFDTLQASLRPSDPALAAAGSVAVSVRGSVDLVNDDLTLNPLPLPAGFPTVVAVGPEGLKYHGLLKTPLTAKAAKGVLVGDLAAVERLLFVWTGREPGGYGGTARAQVGMGPGEGRLNVGLTLTVPDLSRPTSDGKGRRPEGPLTVAFGGGYAPDADRVTFDALSVTSRYARIDASGRVDEATGRRVADLQGTLAPAWEGVTALAAEMVEPGIKLRGRPRPFRVKGPLSGDSAVALLKGLDAEIAVELTEADAFGMKLGPAPVVVRGKGGAFTVDPIQTTLNNGRVTLLPGLVVDEAKGIALTLARGSAIDGAEINDEVSKRVLSYVAPVMDKATHVRGKVAVTVDGAEFPIIAPDGRKTALTGQLSFQDVVFAPGPFATELLTFAGQPDSSGIRLHQPVQLSVADGRVVQKGLEIPIRKDATVALEGSVGFDQTLALRASVPITRGMLGARSGLDDLIGDRKVVVPIDGTVSKPRVDKRALQVALRELSKSVLKKELTKNATDLLNQLGPPPAAGDGGNGKPNGGRDDIKALGDELLRRVVPRRR